MNKDDKNQEEKNLEGQNHEDKEKSCWICHRTFEGKGVFCPECVNRYGTALILFGPAVVAFIVKLATDSSESKPEEEDLQENEKKKT